MEVIEMPAGEPLPRVRERAPTPEPSEEDAPERFQTVPERLRADADCELEIESSEERAERQTLTTRILRYTAAFPAETESFKVSRKKLERRSLPALKELENDISHAVSTRRTASALKSYSLPAFTCSKWGYPTPASRLRG